MTGSSLDAYKIQTFYKLFLDIKHLYVFSPSVSEKSYKRKLHASTNKTLNYIYVMLLCDFAHLSDGQAIWFTIVKNWQSTTLLLRAMKLQFAQIMQIQYVTSIQDRTKNNQHLKIGFRKTMQNGNFYQCAQCDFNPDLDCSFTSSYWPDACNTSWF